MSKKQKIIISITGIFLVLLILVGLTYAYFMTQIKGNTNEKSITITTANLVLVYEEIDENGTIYLENIVPDTIFPTKVFSVRNDGDSTVENYNIYIENVINELERKSDLVYTLTCTSNDVVNSPCTNQILTETTFPSTPGTILKNTLASGDTHTYELIIKYKEMEVDQSVDLEKIISAKINLYDDIINSDNLSLLKTTLLNDSRIIKNTKTVAFTGIESAEVGMYSTEDDYGTSWYFRGAQSYNYVNFAGFTWRVVRINGDGSIRLILDGALDSVIREGETDYAGSRSPFNNPYGGNAYVGYMYGNPNGETYAETHQNLNDSTVKKEVDKFYENYIENDAKSYHYGEYLADSMFCGDKSLANANTSDDNTASGYGMNKTYYGSINRIFYLIKDSSLTTLNPTLKCAEGAEDTYSRYTVDAHTTSKGIATNGDLTYPIGLLSADEIIFAGGHTSSTENRYYLTDARYNSPATLTQDWWTMTPGSASSDSTSDSGFDPENYNNCNLEKTTCYTSNMLYVDLKNGRLTSNDSNQNFTIRPVINLKSNVEVLNGDGTYNYPYVLKELN